MAGKGRPSKYRPELCQAILDYFSVELYREVTEITTDKKGNTTERTVLRANDLPTFGMFAVNVCEVSHQTLLTWTETHPDFLEAYKKAKTYQENFLMQNALHRRYDTGFACFTAKNIMGWRDKTEVEHSGSIGTWADLAAKVAAEKGRV